MDSWKTWSTRLTFGAALAGAVMSRDACLGGSRPRPEPTPAPTATATPAATTAAPATEPAAPAPTATASTFATPP